MLNTLLNENRAIVSEIAGTTRDTIEEILNIDGILFRLIDTAGIREHSPDVIENMGVLKSKEKISQADIVLYMFDMNMMNIKQLLPLMREIKNQNPNLIPVANKIDTSPDDVLQNIKDALPGTIFISAQYHTGIELLKEKLFSMAAGNEVLSENIIVTNARHFSALKEIQVSLEEIKKGMENNLSGDLLSLDIRRCLHYLGEITGEISNEDMLDYIFSKFCIGK